MDGASIDTSPEALIRVIEENRFQAFSSFGCTPQGELRDAAYALQVATGVPALSPLSSWVFRGNLPQGQEDVAVREVIDFFRNRSLPFIWNIGPSTHPKDLGRILTAQGLTRLFDIEGMAIELSQLVDDMVRPLGCTVENVTTEDAFGAWAQVFRNGFNAFAGSDHALRAMHRLIVDSWRAAEGRWHHYLGFLDGKPVATSSMFLGAGVAGIYFVSTVREARKRGIGSIMTLVPLLEARARGIHISVLHASPLATSIYRQMGFKRYCTLEMYVWQPTQETI